MLYLELSGSAMLTRILECDVKLLEVSYIAEGVDDSVIKWDPSERLVGRVKLLDNF